MHLIQQLTGSEIGPARSVESVYDAWELDEVLQVQGRLKRLSCRVAIPPSPELAAEILAHQYFHRPADGRIILEGKDELRSRLGRSPDLFDALAMAFGSVGESFARISASDGIVDF